MICVCIEMILILDKEIWFKVIVYNLFKDIFEVEYGVDWLRGENIWIKGFFKDFV